MSDETGAEKVARLMRRTRIAMLTTSTPDGLLASRPMATQDVDFDGDVWFVAERSSDLVAQVSERPRVNVAYASDSSWVSLSGRAEVREDPERLAELWGTFTDAWMEGGPESPENVLVHVHADSAEYWDSPGSKVTQVVNLVKAKVTGERYEAEQGSVAL